MKAYIKPSTVVVHVAPAPIMDRSRIGFDPNKGTGDNFVRGEEDFYDWEDEEESSDWQW